MSNIIQSERQRASLVFTLLLIFCVIVTFYSFQHNPTYDMNVTNGYGWLAALGIVGIVCSCTALAIIISEWVLEGT